MLYRKRQQKKRYEESFGSNNLGDDKGSMKSGKKGSASKSVKGSFGGSQRGSGGSFVSADGRLRENNIGNPIIERKIVGGMGTPISQPTMERNYTPPPPPQAPSRPRRSDSQNDGYNMGSTERMKLVPSEFGLIAVPVEDIANSPVYGAPVPRYPERGLERAVEYSPRSSGRVDSTTGNSTYGKMLYDVRSQPF